MSDVTYVVETVFESKGSGQLEQATFGAGGARGFEGKVGSLYGAFERLDSQLRGMGRSIMAPFDAIANKVVDVGVGLGKLGAVAGVGAVTYGVAKLNNELEKTNISLGAMFEANGKAGNIAGGMKLGAEVMSQMRKDAAALPGEFEDLVGIFKTIAIPGFGAGASIKQLEAMSAKTMAFGAVAGLPQEQVAREMAMLMEGRAGGHNVLGMRLMGLGGEKAEKFNKESPAKRLEELTVHLDKYKGSIDAYSRSFEGLSSTFMDNGKRFLGLSTGPLFEKVKGALGEVNDWFSRNQNRIEDVATLIGSKFSYAFDWAKEKLLEWWPAIETFAINAYNTFGRMWKEASPLIDKAATVMKEFLANPNAMNMIMTAGKYYAGAKVGGGVLSGAANVGMGAMGLVQTLKMLGIGGGAVAGAGAGMSSAGMGAMGSAAWAAQGATTMGAMGSGTIAAQGAFATMTGASSTAATSLAAFAGVALPATAALAAVGAAAYEGVGLWQDIENDRLKNVHMYIDVANRYIEGMKGISADAPELVTSIQSLRANGDEAAAAQLELKAAALGAASALDAISLGKRYREGIDKQQSYDIRNSADFDAALNAAAAKAGKGHPGGGGGTSVKEVIIQVTSNQDPSRIARMVYGEMMNLSRHPKISRDVKNYSAAGT